MNMSVEPYDDTPVDCTGCGVLIVSNDKAVYAIGYGYGSRRFELILCETCASRFRDEIDDTLDPENWPELEEVELANSVRGRQDR